MRMHRALHVHVRECDDCLDAVRHALALDGGDKRDLSLDQTKQLVRLVFRKRIGFDIKQDSFPRRHVGKRCRAGRGQGAPHLIEQIQASPFHGAERQAAKTFNKTETQARVVPDDRSRHASIRRLWLP